MRTTLQVGKLGLKKRFLPWRPDSIFHLPEGLFQREHWQLHPLRPWKLNKRNAGEVSFVQYFSIAGRWHLSLRGTPAPVPWSSGRGGCPAPIMALGGDQLWWEMSPIFKDNHCHSVHHQAGRDIKSPWIHFLDSKLPVGYFPRNCIPHRIASIHRTFLSLRGGNFNSSETSIWLLESGRQ